MSEDEKPDKGAFVAEMQAGMHVVGFYRAREVSLQSYRGSRGGSYLRVELADRTGSIPARMWENADSGYADATRTGIVKVEGEVERYREQLQVRVIRLRAAIPVETDPADLLASTRRSIDEMNAAIDQAIEGMRNAEVAKLVRMFYDQTEFRARLASLPAGRRVHHAYRGGLLEHVFEVLLLSRPLVELYPEIDADLLTAGILLHDIGKLQELGGEDGMEYTDVGRLVGHVVLGAERVASAEAAIPGFPADTALQLEHMILSHHGRYEWASPRRPKTLEAVALHHLENLDGQVNRFRSLIEVARQAGRVWTDYDNLLERSLYAGEGGLSPEEAGQAS